MSRTPLQIAEAFLAYAKNVKENAKRKYDDASISLDIASALFAQAQDIYSAIKEESENE